MATTASPAAPPEGLSQRVSRLEGAYEHLATKADLAQLELRLAEKFGHQVRPTRDEVQSA